MRFLQHYGSGEIKISRQGSIKFGRVTIQRKGGDRGRQQPICCNLK